MIILANTSCRLADGHHRADFSGKGLTHIRRDLVLPLMLFIGFTAVMLFTFPWITLTA
jgi:hypothetical protein